MRLKVIFIVLFFVTVAHSFEFNGRFSTKYEYSNDDNRYDRNRWENILILDNTEIIKNYLNFNFYGKFYVEDKDGDTKDFTDIYSGYLDFRTFENRFHLKVGRFNYINNTFMTIDGAEATYRTDYYFGITLFGGIPKYLDKDDRHINDEFRETGEVIYGGKLFLNGVENTTGYLSYSREEDDSNTVQELLGAGVGRTFIDLFVKDLKLNIDVKMDYELNEDELYKADIKGSLEYKKFVLILGYTRFNVKDGFRGGRELVISNFSTGREDRYFYTIEYWINENIKIYQGLVHTLVKYPSGEWVSGNIVKAGADFSYFKEAGVFTGINGYYYENDIANAGGAGYYLDWNITNDLKWGVEGEYVKMNHWNDDYGIFSFYTDLEYKISKHYLLGAYFEKNEKTRYLPQERVGVKIEYIF